MAMTAATGLLIDPIYQKHRTAAAHPESPHRVESLLAALSPLVDELGLVRLAPHPASFTNLLRCHTAAYLELVQKEITTGLPALSTGDTLVCPASWEIACHAVGGCLAALDAIISGSLNNAFCAVRPPGHHATADRGMGFCILNNVAIAARHAQAVHGIGKILIVDWDVHHGNGTQSIFYEDPSVFFLSTHQENLYPRGSGHSTETGSGPGLGTTLNRPFPPGSGRREILPVYTELLTERMAEFKPELVLISAGFDSRIGDPLGQFTLTDDDFTDLTRHMRAIADEHAEGRILSILEGGYHLAGLSKAATAHVKALCQK